LFRAYLPPLHQGWNQSNVSDILKEAHGRRADGHQPKILWGEEPGKHQNPYEKYDFVAAQLNNLPYQGFASPSCRFFDHLQ
jgi:hypothetical protein